ncbi:MAG TPA: ABC transporter substrate-binding protein [Actinomycetota bacterium]|jgi:osmoprotectant transport system substrate-binding protein
MARRSGRTSVSAILCTIVLAAGCARSGSAPPASALGDGAVTIGSFDFPESALLGELYAQALEGHGIRVVRRFALGPRELVLPALQRGLIELVPEYVGSALAYLGGSPSAEATPTLLRLRGVLADRGLSALAPALAQDQNGFVVTADTASRLDLHALTDLIPHADELTLGGPAECPTRRLCLRGLEEVYGLRFGGFLALDAGGPLTLEGLLSGAIDVGLLFTTDGTIERRGFVLLADDRHLQPAENVTPVVRTDALERFGPELGEALDAIAAVLDTQTLRGLNAAVDAGAPMAEVARTWLDAHGLRTG